MLMHVEYRVSLPDHDWVVAAQHKLTPSVYAGIVVQPNGLGKPEAVSYSGPTYIAIRSGKHSSSTAYAHTLDFERLLQLPEFDTITMQVWTRQSSETCHCHYYRWWYRCRPVGWSGDGEVRESNKVELMKSGYD